MAALQYVHVPGYAALILRRTYADLALPGAIMDRAASWLTGTDATWNGTDKRWSFPSGATLSFGYLDTERDRFRYQGAELQFIGFDELTQFPESWYVYLLSRLRRLRDSQVPIRARAATNPGGIGHEWVRRRFIVPEAGSARAYVPATLIDNPSLDRVLYERSLEALDPTTRKQLRDGLWVRDSGGLVYAHYDERRNTGPVPKLTSYLLGLDFGFTDATAFCILGWREHDPTVYVVESFKECGLTPGQVAERVAELEQRYKFTRIVGDIGGLGKGYAEEARRRYRLPIEPAEKHNKRGYIDLLNGALHNGTIRIQALLNVSLIAEMLELPWDKERKAEEPGFDNHLCDAFLYAWRACSAFIEVPDAPKPKPGSSEALKAEEDALEQFAIRELEKASEDNWIQ